ncbi:MAG: hypothetical protein HRT95_17925 [Moritella sp.]|nr:hypothetical protein [Moritella sp.]
MYEGPTGTYKLTPNSIDGAVNEYTADIVSMQDYYPGGMPMPGRTFNGGDYRYGFNGQEKDDEIKGNGNSYTAQYWQYDPRLGRRWNTDPVVKANWSGYAAFGDNPILFVDPNGDDWFENSAGRVEWFDNNSGGFLSDNQTAWSNIGGTLSANSATNDKLGGTLLAGQALVAISGPSDYSKLGSFDASASLFDNGGASYTTPGNGNVYFPTGSSPDASKLTHSNGVFNLNDNTS